MDQPVSRVIDGLSVLRGGVFSYIDLIPNQIQTDFYFCRHFVKSPIGAFVREKLIYIIIVSDKQIRL